MYAKDYIYIYISLAINKTMNECLLNNQQSPADLECTWDFMSFRNDVATLQGW